MPDVHLIQDPAIERQIEGAIQALVKRLHPLGAMNSWRGWSASQLADSLACVHGGPHYPDAHEAAHMILNGILNPCDVQSPDLWGSPLGRALAYWGTGVPASVSRACAAAALGCGRANVSLMVRNGQLSEELAHAEDGTLRISTSSLAHAMRQRHPLGIDHGRA
jgi:hypothetical protein